MDHHSGLQIPLPWDEDVLAMLVDRVARAQDALGAQLLLENGVVHTPVRDSDMSEPEFMNELAQRSGCGLLLDLHNLYVNSVNLGLDAGAFLDELDLARCARSTWRAGTNSTASISTRTRARARRRCGACSPAPRRAVAASPA